MHELSTLHDDYLFYEVIAGRGVRIVMNKRWFVKHVITRLCLGTVIFLTACSASREAAPDAQFVLLDGAKLSTATMKGKVYLVNFWATSCTSCVKEMPEVVSTYRKFASQGFDVVAVAMSYDAPAYVVHFAQTRQLPFKVAIDNTGVVAKAFNDVKVTPTSYLIDKQGRIAKRWEGEPNFTALHSAIEALLKAPA
jgi:peroxiredoxin